MTANKPDDAIDFEMVQHVSTMQEGRYPQPFEDASKMINRVAACRWRVPQGVNAREYKPEGAVGL